MKFAFLHHSNPLSESLWSGIPLNIVHTLRELGHEVVPVGSLKPLSPLVPRAKAAFYKYLRKQTYLLNRDPAVCRQRSVDATRLLQELGPVDAVLVTYPPDAAFLQAGSPLIVIHDATWTQLINFYPGHGSRLLAAETISGGTELDRMALAKCDHAIYSSNWAADRAVAEFGIAEYKVSVASLGANMANAPSRAEVESFLTKRGRTQEPMKLLFVGKEWYRKGGDIALGVAVEIEKMGEAVELHVVGCDPQGEVPSFVHAHGWLRKDVPSEIAELRDLYETSDFFIMPTRADATPVVFAEAAAFGMPAISTNVGGIKDVLTGAWGFTAPLGTSPFNYAAWAVNQYRDRTKYAQLSALARASYEDHLNWPAFCRHLLHVVETLV